MEGEAPLEAGETSLSRDTLTPVTSTPKRPVGRPLTPENKALIAELKARVDELTAQLNAATDPYEEMKKLAEVIRLIQRAMKGLGVDDDVFLGLINAKDIRERTRLDEATLLSHSAMRIASKRWPIFAMFRDIADEEDPYYISEDGEGRREGILLRQAQSKLDANLILNMPNTQGGVAQTEQAQANPQPQKKGFLQRINPFKR